MASEMHARTTRLRRGIRAFVENRAENILERISEKKADEVYHKHQLARTWMYWRDSLYDKQSQDALIGMYATISILLCSYVDFQGRHALSREVSVEMGVTVLRFNLILCTCYAMHVNIQNINQKATRHYTRMLKMKMIAAWLKCMYGVGV